MKTLLCFPPSFAVDQPYLALPALAAFLRSHGTACVQQWDLNIESFWHFLAKDRLKGATENASQVRRQLEGTRNPLSPQETRQYESMVAAELAADPVLEEIEAARDYFLHCTRQTSLAEYQFYLRVIAKALRIASAPYYPSEMSLRDFTMRHSPQSSADIFAAIQSSENPYTGYFTQRVLPRLQSANPALVGVSVACMSQIIPSFTLASLIREALPGTRIVFGGQVFNRLADRVRETPALFRLVDFFILHEGETALLSLCQSLQGKLPLDMVPNLIRLDPETGHPTQTPRFHVEDVAKLPPPDFSDLDLSQYLSPRVVLPYQPVRGCYWHRCAFCNHHVIHPAAARHRTPEDLVRDLGALKAVYATDLFTIVSESVEPALMKTYARSITEAGLSVRWYAGARMEAALDTDGLATLRTAGCEKLYFGLETGSQKVLNDMRKGIRLLDAERILRDCSRHGIAVHLFLMIGYPNETCEDLEQSRRETLRLAGLAPREGFTYYISTFQLKPQTPIFLKPSAFGISKVHRRDTTKDLEYLYDFDVKAPPAVSDYTREAKAIEAALDEVHGPYEYPENIVHYMAMREHMAAGNALPQEEASLPKPLSEDVRLRVRQALGFAVGVSSATPTGSKIHACPGPHLIYDLTTDCTYAIRVPLVWVALRTLRNPFTVKELRTALKGDGDHDKTDLSTDADRLVQDMLYSGLVVQVAEGD